MRYKSFLFIAALIAVLAAAPGAYALHSAEHYSLVDEASYVSPGNASDRAVHLVSDASPGSASVDFGVEDGLTFADIGELSTDFRFEEDDSCGGGSPRFQISVSSSTEEDSGNIFVYLGDAPNYNSCDDGVWLSSGDLLNGTSTIDTSQLDGGTFYDPYDSALERYGAYSVDSIALVADAGWADSDGEQALDVDNTMVDATLFTYEVPDDDEPPVPPEDDKEACKNGGWMDMTDDEDNAFRNQGQCVSFFARMK